MVKAVTSKHPLVEKLRPGGETTPWWMSLLYYFGILLNIRRRNYALVDKPLHEGGAALRCALVVELLHGERQRYPPDRITPAITRPAIGTMKGHSRDRGRHQRRILDFKRLHHPGLNNSGPGPIFLLPLTRNFHINPF